MNGGKLIVLTAPLTESIDHAGYFIQMSMASLPIWLEGILNKKYPKWRDVERNEDGSARYMPAGLRVLEASLLREFDSRRHRRLLSGGPRQVHRARHARRRHFDAQPARRDVRGRRLRVDFRIEPAADQLALRARDVRQGQGQPVPEELQGDRRRLRRLADLADQHLGRAERGLHRRRARANPATRWICSRRPSAARTSPASSRSAIPRSRDEILVPDKRTTFGVVEMTTGCGRRCQFCLPDLNPQIDVSKEQIMAGVRANVRDGNNQISLATEDMFIWGQVHTDTPFYFPNREALLDLYSEHRQHPRRRAPRLQPRDDRAGRRRSPADREADRSLHRQEPDQDSAAQHASRKARARPAHRPRNRRRSAWPSRSCRARACRSRSTTGRAW